MKLTKRTIAAWALTAAALFGIAAAPQASAAPAYVTGYHFYQAESYNPSFGSSGFVSFHATNNYSQIWLNGSVSCAAYNDNARVTWCGWIWPDNGTAHVQAGVNYTVYSQSFYLRINVWAPAVHGQLTCSTQGNAGSHFVTYCAALAARLLQGDPAACSSRPPDRIKGHAR